MVDLKNAEFFLHGIQLIYLLQMIEERRQRYLQPGNSRYALEPHVKEGIGGLRDLHTLYWITRARFDDTGPEALHRNGLLTAFGKITYLNICFFVAPNE